MFGTWSTAVLECHWLEPNETVADICALNSVSSGKKGEHLLMNNLLYRFLIIIEIVVHEVL